MTFAHKFEAIGTIWNIEVFEAFEVFEASRPLTAKVTNLSSISSKELMRTIDGCIESFDKLYSRFRNDSLIATMARKSGTYRLPANAKPLLDLYRQLYDLTGGVVTPLIGRTLVDAGYDATYSLRPGNVSQPPAWDEVMDYDFPNLKLKLPSLLDFGAAGKGYLVDLIDQLLVRHGLENFYIDAGGDMMYRTFGDKQLQIGLENPADPTQAVGIASIKNQSLCGSAGNRRKWDKYHHILHPHSLASPQHIQAVWVVANSGLVADGLATALFFVPAKILQPQYTFEHAIIYADQSLEHSTGFPAEFFTTKDP